MIRDILQERLTALMNTGDDVEAGAATIQEILDENDRIINESTGFENAVTRLTQENQQLTGRYNELKANYISRFNAPVKPAADPEDESDPDKPISYDSLFSKKGSKK